MSAPSSHAHPEHELVAGRYLVGHTIGRGGMGKVVHAKHVDLKQEVAIKYLRTSYRSGGESAAKRFCQEALTYASINHPNIVKLLDFERTSHGELRMVLEYVKGETLGSFLRRHGQCHPMFAIEITTQIAQGLSAAHARSIIHRDLKPDNIMLCPVTRTRRHYHVKLLDFGIAKNLHYEGERYTAAGTVCGTPDYMSPEQARGMDIDVRSDVYSLGVLFFEMLAGRLPYIATGKHEVMSAHCFTPIPMVSDFSDYPIPVSVEDVLQRCLAKNPRDRFQTVEELIDALDFVAEREYDQVSAVKYNALTPEGEQLRFRQHPARQLDAKDFESSIDIDALSLSDEALVIPDQPQLKPHAQANLPLSVLVNSDLSSAEQADPGLDKVRVPPKESVSSQQASGSIDDFRVEGVRMMSLRAWFSSMIQDMQQINQESYGTVVSGIGFILLVLTVTSTYLQPQSVAPHQEISHHVEQDVSSHESEQRENVPSVGPSTAASGHRASVALPMRSTPEVDTDAALIAKREQSKRIQSTIRRAERLFTQGKLEQSLDLVAPYTSEERAAHLVKKIRLLKSYLKRAKSLSCVRFLKVSEAHVDIAGHPLVKAQKKRCQRATPPRSLR